MKFVSHLLSRTMPLWSFGRGFRQVVRFQVECLETRRLLSVAIQAIPAQTIPQGTTPQALDLTQAFADNTTQQADLTFTTQSNNPSVVQPSISGTVLTLTLRRRVGHRGHYGRCEAPDGSTAALAFRVKVPASTDRSLDVVLGPARKSFRYVESNGTSGTITLSGPGTAVIHMGGDNLVQIGDHARGSNQEIESITVTGTTSATSLVDIGVVRKGGFRPRPGRHYHRWRTWRAARDQYICPG